MNQLYLVSSPNSTSTRCGDDGDGEEKVDEDYTRRGLATGSDQLTTGRDEENFHLPMVGWGDLICVLIFLLAPINGHSSFFNLMEHQHEYNSPEIQIAGGQEEQTKLYFYW